MWNRGETEYAIRRNRSETEDNFNRFDVTVESRLVITDATFETT